MSTETNPIAGAPPEGAATMTPAPEAGAVTTSGGESQGGGGGALPQPPPPSVPAEIASRLAELEAENAKLREATAAGQDLETQVQNLRAQNERHAAALAISRRHALLGALADVPEDLRPDVATIIGDVDVATDEGRAKVQAFLQNRPSLVRRTTAGERAQVMEPEHFDQLRKSVFAPAIDFEARRQAYADANGRVR